MDTNFVAGHSRLITNGHANNQPTGFSGIYVLHNGIVLNSEKIWDEIKLESKLQIDSEVIPALAKYFLMQGIELEAIPSLILEKCEGVVACALIYPSVGKLSLFSNNGSLFYSIDHNELYFASERNSLIKIGCANINQIYASITFDIPVSAINDEINVEIPRLDLVPTLAHDSTQAKLLEYDWIDLKRCTRCILPNTMPYIEFDQEGVCNYCLHYRRRNQPKPIRELEQLLEKYRGKNGIECIFPFSGGRDSSFGLHLAVKELGIKPIAYTYDWGMVTDLGRRNISRMCSELGVENIIIAADIAWKRNNIKKNLVAWLKHPNLGMLSLLTAGDKHFFRHIEQIKSETQINLNLWSVNPLEVTHFKTGFMGIPPDFQQNLVYQSGLRKQIDYQSKRFKQMLSSPGYFNSSIFDTLSGEYFRSRKNKSDYYHLFDYWRWDEGEIDRTLEDYDWERAIDTSTTWRIGDGTAAFYNYVYHRVAGFSEHDTFRSNQIREGDISRAEALRLIAEENLPRYANIKWYLDSIGLPFREVIETINSISRLGIE
jgi:asparagine synthetase B (glutamine-hydrolysing)